jgi:hypothetical protein
MPRDALLAELRRLSPRELELVLRPLQPAECSLVMALVRERQERDTPLPPFEALAGLSPWLLRAIERSEGNAARAGAPMMTAAARAALSDAMRQLAQSQPAGAQVVENSPRMLGRIFPWRRPPARAA